MNLLLSYVMLSDQSSLERTVYIIATIRDIIVAFALKYPKIL